MGGSIRDDTNDPEALYKRGVRWQAQGFLALALKYFDEALDAGGSKADFWLSRGVVLREMGRREEALASIAKAIGIDPADVRLHFEEAITLDYMGRTEEAVAVFEPLLQSGDRVARVLSSYYLGLLYVRFGRPLDAFSCLDQALASEPGFASALSAKGGCLMRDARFEEAIASFEQALSIKRDLLDAWLREGETLILFGRLEEALAVYDEAIELRVVSPVVFGRDVATRLLKRIAGEDVAPLPERYWAGRPPSFDQMLQSVELFSEGRIEDAMASCEKGLAVDPEKWNLLNGKAACLLRIGRAEEALLCLNRALLHEPLEAQLWHNKGCALAEIGREEEAALFFGVGEALDPVHASEWISDGRAYREICRYDLTMGRYINAPWED